MLTFYPEIFVPLFWVLPSSVQKPTESTVNVMSQWVPASCNDAQPLPGPPNLIKSWPSSEPNAITTVECTPKWSPPPLHMPHSPFASCHASRAHMQALFFHKRSAKEFGSNSLPIICLARLMRTFQSLTPLFPQFRENLIIPIFDSQSLFCSQVSRWFLNFPLIVHCNWC